LITRNQIKMGIRLMKDEDPTTYNGYDYAVEYKHTSCGHIT